MQLFWKNKGLYVLLYIVVSVVATNIILAKIKELIGGSLSFIDFYLALGIALIIAAVLTYFKKDDYYIDDEGKKIKMDTENEFMYISMDLWFYILLIVGVLSLGKSIHHLLLK